MSARRLFIAAIALGTLLRLVQLATSLGTLDALLWFNWATLIERVGILRSYQYNAMMNHPPLVLLIARGVNAIGSACGLEFNDSFRLLQCAADVVTALLLVGIARTFGAKNEYAAAAMFFLSPAAIFISAFHCNSDPLMMMLLTAAVLMVVRERPAIAGVLLALAVGIKIVPLLVGPLLLFALRGTKARLLFLATAAVTSAIIFVPGIVVSGPLFLRRVFGYTGSPTGWGWMLLGVLIGKLTGFRGLALAAQYLTYVMVAALGALWVAEWKRDDRRERLVQMVGVGYLVVLFLARGFAVQYLFWILPWLGFTLPRRAALALHGLVSVLLFMLYTFWSYGWPWWFARASRTPQEGAIAAYVGLVVWAAMGAAALYSIRRRYSSSSSSSPPALLYFLVLL